MYTALYRAYRPEVFDQLLGQEHIVRILKNQIASGTTSHAYLFCGTRGTGKTTTARLLAKGLNCTSEGEKPCGQCETCRSIAAGNYLDVVEIDAASNRGIDDIRQLRDSVNYPPAEGRHKVYIIDEVHMLSTEAFNALLKTLEEPPEYVTFILATTEPRKLPATILSRCLRLDFRRVPETVLIQGMKKICDNIGIEVTEPALRIIAANADGSVRDGLSILDQCISGGEQRVDTQQVLDFLGASGETVFLELTDLVTKRRTAEAIAYLGEVLADGKDVRQLIRDWVVHYRNLMMTKFIRDPQPAINLSVENIDRVRQQSSIMQLEDINRGIMELSKTADQARWSTQPRILLEVCIVNLCQGSGVLPARSRGEQTGGSDRQAGAAGNDRPIAEQPRQAGAAGGTDAPRVKTDSDSSLETRRKDPAPQGNPADGMPPASTEAEADGEDGLDALIAAARGNRNPQEGTGNPAGAEPSGSRFSGAEPSDASPSGLDSASMSPSGLESADMSPDPGTADREETDLPESPQADGDQELLSLWDEVFADGEHVKGSIYLIRANSMLTKMDENTFTVTADNERTKRQTERNRGLLEDLMEARTGKRRRMLVEVRPEKDDREISAEEAAARASEILGTTVTVE